MQLTRDENEVFQDYLRANGSFEYAQELYALLKQHAHRVVKREGLKTAQQDIINEACWHGMRLPTRFKGQSKFSTWFHGIVLTLCKHEVRERSKRRESQLDDTIDPIVSNSDRVDLVTEELFNPLDQRLLRLKLDGARYTEIAKTLGITEGNARTRWFRITRKLKALGGVSARGDTADDY